MKPMLIVMVGLQCSGKSTKAKEFALEYNAKVLSSDEIRKRFPDAKNETVFRLLYEQMNSLLESGVNVIVDATGTTIKMRKLLLSNVKQPCTKICHIMNTPYEECVKRLGKRNKEVIIDNLETLIEDLHGILSYLEDDYFSAEDCLSEITKRIKIFEKGAGVKIGQE